MSRLLCCLRATPDMGAALSHPQEGEACDGAVTVSPPTMADVIRERKKKAGGAGLGTLRRRIAAATRRTRDSRPDRGCEHARYIRSVVSSWRLSEVFLLGEQLEGAAALRDLATQAELAREPAAALHADLAAVLRDRWWCDVELVGAGWAAAAHSALLAARSGYFRDLLQRQPGACRVPLEGLGATLTREELEACLLTIYSGAPPTRRSLCLSCNKYEHGLGSEAELDIISIENSTMRTGGCGGCGRARVGGARLRRLCELLAVAPADLARDLRRLLESGERCDTRLWWRAEGAAFGFRSALELPCHRVVLAARSRFFRSVLGRQRGAVCVDEQVLPRRFARALLHAAYTDQVDLSLIGRSSSSPPSTNSSGSGTTRGNGSKNSTITMLDDAFQLYEIARFLEMPIVVQGCEDAVARALSADTLPHVLRWSSGAHASRWVHRQAMRLLRDEFPAALAAAGAGRLPAGALAAALRSPFLQAPEPAALRALLRWAERAAPAPAPAPAEPNVLWHTAHAGRRARRAARAARAGDAAVRDALATLAPLLRLEHVPPDCDVLQQALRRGIVPPPLQPDEGCVADAWLGRGSFRPARCFLPYLDEIKALLEDQEVPEAELARARRQRYLHRIPDTLYMVAAARENDTSDGAAGGAGRGAWACVGGRARRALRARARELRHAPPAARALALHAPDSAPVRRQIALRAVREMSLPDACAELLMNEPDPSEDRDADGDGSEAEWEGAEGLDISSHRPPSAECCRSGSGSLRCVSAGSLRGTAPLPSEYSASSAPWAVGRPAALDTQHRAGWRRLSAAVPDVAQAPNANTHLLTALRPAPRPAPPLQLDLGDGATHTPRPGSRAQRAGVARIRTYCPSSRRDDDELRVAYELSREYAVRSRASPSPSSLSGGRGVGEGPPAAPGAARRRPDTHSLTRLPTLT